MHFNILATFDLLHVIALILILMLPLSFCNNKNN